MKTLDFKGKQYFRFDKEPGNGPQRSAAIGTRVHFGGSFPRKAQLTTIFLLSRTQTISLISHWHFHRVKKNSTFQFVTPTARLNHSTNPSLLKKSGDWRTLWPSRSTRLVPPNRELHIQTLFRTTTWLLSGCVCVWLFMVADLRCIL